MPAEPISHVAPGRPASRPDTDWAWSATYSILGHSIRVRTNCEGQARRVRWFLRRFPALQDRLTTPHSTYSVRIASPFSPGNAAPDHAVYRDESLVGRASHPDDLLRLFEAGLDAMLTASTGNRMLIHAGAVARHGRGIMLPGASGWGKSTLTLALTERGFAYLSDEFAVLDPLTVAIEALPKPVSVRDPSVFPLDLARYGDWLGNSRQADTGPEPIQYVHAWTTANELTGLDYPVEFIIFPRYDAAATPRLTPLEPGLAARLLLESSANLRALGGYGIGAVSRLVAQARCFSLSTGPLEPTCQLVERLVDEGAVPA